MMIDLNADLGEGGANDSALLQLVSSANIACGFHAGDAGLMVQSVREALKYGVAVGAHPGYPDRENFGRTAMDLPPETVYAQMLYQIGALAAIVQAQGGELQHVKPHGMLYNQAAKSPPLADAIARAIRDVNPKLVLVGLAGSELIRAGQHYGLTTRQEVFADRGYLADGSLVPRSQPGAPDRQRRAGSGANPRDGAAPPGAQHQRRVGERGGADGVSARRWPARAGFCPPSAGGLCRAHILVSAQLDAEA